MANAIFKNVQISGIAAAVPSHIEKATDYIGRMTEDEVDQFVRGTGVKERHVVHEKQTTSDLCCVAAERLIKSKGYDKDSFDALIFVTQTPDYLQPATAHILHLRLGMPMDCMAFDVSLGCSGYIYGLHIAASLLQSENFKRILLLSGEVERPNPLIPIKDHILFGNAGTATIIEKGETEICTLLRSDGRDYSALIIPGGNLRNPITDEAKYFEAICPRMDGETVFAFSITKVPRAFKDFYEIYGCGPENFDFCVLHQANEQIMKIVSKKAGFTWDKVPVSLDRYGNTSSASVPLTIADMCERQPKNRKLKLIMSGFGIGMSWGVASVIIDTSDVLPVITTDDYFKEAYHVDC